MQYEAIILELMARIKNLEEEVLRLREEQNNLSELILQGREEEPEEPDSQADDEGSAPYRKMTDEMIDICYQYGKTASGSRSIHDLAREIAERTGMNQNSAIMYLYAVNGMLNGTVYKRAINSKATHRYLERILDEFGKEGLKKALKAMRLHIDYRKACGHTVDSLEEIYEQHNGRI